MAGASIEMNEGSGAKSEWVRAHEALSLLAVERAAADAEEGRWLLAALRSAAHVHLGYGSFGEYIERLFGYKPRSTQEKLRVAEGLEELPAIARALANGELNWPREPPDRTLCLPGVQPGLPARERRTHTRQRRRRRNGRVRRSAPRGDHASRCRRGSHQGRRL
jgi:hypothetical protein